MRPLSAHVSRFQRLALVLGLVFSTSACNTYDPGIPLPDILDEINATLMPDVPLLQVGDVVSVSFNDKETADKYDIEKARVGPGGVIQFKDLVDVDAVGLSVEELEFTLERLIEEDQTKPECEIRIETMANREAVFIGMLKTVKMSVLPALKIDFIETMARVGGEGNTFTLLESVVLIRWVNEGQFRRRRFWVIDVREKYWTNPESLYLQAGDIVYIPTHPIKKTGDWIRELTRLIPLPQIFRLSN